ncbi:hydroxyisourate hydrolase [Blastococcus sp. LR1]|uniref:hydroxyisourate hydrolase n=1 Tax=Blastococcus sp. LR1 TaxID=2877000 RepID=UPI001CCA1856|nr:hydroxyisourate hydrolase [Blastococcus sp. LR1]MCA0145356.1 hydroxyisourate hydrolase [Blastococcus sp. LR1]
MSISTHVLDTAVGRPVRGMAVRLASGDGDVVADRVTDADGRVPDLAGDLPAGVYRLTFDVAGSAGEDAFYPEVVVAFRITDPAAHVHVPLALSPFAYSTYRGS